jgi:hypothetical protein
LRRKHFQEFQKKHNSVPLSTNSVPHSIALASWHPTNPDNMFRGARPARRFFEQVAW